MRRSLGWYLLLGDYGHCVLVVVVVGGVVVVVVVVVVN
jgi:hypothetical protein